MLVGFTNMVVSLWEMEQPRSVFVGWDTIGEPTYRHELFPATRRGPRPPGSCFSSTLAPGARRGAPRLRVGEGALREADDFLAAAVAAEEADEGKALVVTNDRDLFPAGRRRTTLLLPRRGVSEIERVGPAEVEKATYDVPPALVPDFIALQRRLLRQDPRRARRRAGRAAGVLKKLRLAGRGAPGEWLPRPRPMTSAPTCASPRLPTPAPLQEIPRRPATLVGSADLVGELGPEPALGLVTRRAA